MLQAHFRAIEGILVAQSQIASNSGHPVHKGTLREEFVKVFLSTHLSELVAVGSGEVIDANSKANESRNQHDIVVYWRSFPKLHLSQNIDAFLIESVVATLEIKSSLDRAGLRQSIIAARNLKLLMPHSEPLIGGDITIKVPSQKRSYVVAYDGPASMDTVLNWYTEIHNEENIPFPPMPQSEMERLYSHSPSIDGIFILGKGFQYYDNVRVGFINEAERTENTNIRWVSASGNNDVLLCLFLFLTTIIGGMAFEILNPAPYLSNVHFPNRKVFRHP